MHRTTSRALAPLVLTGLLIGACGSEVEVAIEELDATVVTDRVEAALATLDEPWCEPFADRFCETIERCGCDSAPGWPEDCHGLAMRTCQRNLAITAATLPDGFLISTDGIPKCLAEVDEAFARCDRTNATEFPVICQLVVPLEGASFPRAGEPCTNGGLCSRGLRCGSDRICRQPHPIGDRCASDGECEFPNVCRSDGCEDGICRSLCVAPAAPANIGQSCLFGCSENMECGLSRRQTCIAISPTDLCFSDFECATNQFCNFETSPNPRCNALPREGSRCVDGFRCAPGLSCDPNTGLCALPPRAGQRCIGQETGNPSCAEGLACHIDGICGAPGERGETCIFGLNGCAAGLTCNFDALGQPRCTDFVEIDGQCQNDAVCRPEAACDFRTFTCQLRHLEGERCDDGRRCAVDTFCVDKLPGELRCAKVTKEGDPCAGVCPDDLRCRSVDAQGVCVPPICNSVSF